MGLPKDPGATAPTRSAPPPSRTRTEEFPPEKLAGAELAFAPNATLYAPGLDAVNVKVAFFPAVS